MIDEEAVHAKKLPNEQGIRAHDPSSQPDGSVGSLDILSRLWTLFTHPALLLGAGLLTMMLLFSALALPQMPGQFNDIPSSASRWLRNQAMAYGRAGEVLSDLGLFNALHSPLLKILLTSIAFILLIHLGDLLGGAWRYRQLENRARIKTTGAGLPTRLPHNQRLARLRVAIPMTMDSAATTLAEHFNSAFDHVEQTKIGFSAMDGTTSTVDSQDGKGERRILAMRHRRAMYMRPLLVLGLLLAVGAIWLPVMFGWEVALPTLAPGESVGYARHDLMFQYLPRSEENERPHILASIGDSGGSLDAESEKNIDLSGVTVQVRPGIPGLLLSMESGAAALMRPGQAEPSAAVGLTFPSPGSEESLVVPEESLGLRIVRLPDEGDSDQGSFMIETYVIGSVDPPTRIQIGDELAQGIPLGESGAMLSILPLSGVDVEARYWPGAWLIWPALVLVIPGAYGFWRRPAFLLAQIGEWSDERAVVIAQGDLSADLDATRNWVEQMQEESGNRDSTPGTR